jgi:hypothetical protein
MDLTPYVTTLRDDLRAAAAAGDEDTQRIATVLAAALEPAARLAIMNALSDLAAEVTAALEDRVVELRLDGRDVRVTVTGHPAEPAAPPPPPPPPFGPDFGGDVSRITLRLFEEIKTQAERAAAAQGVSLNSWLSQAVQGALQNSGFRDWSDSRHGERPGGRHGSRRMRGWVQG